MSAGRDDRADDRPGHDPDPRFTYANERTFLAWNRTALALIGGGLVVAQFLHLGFRGSRLIIALPLMGLGVALSLASFRRWQRNERAMRLDEPLPASSLPTVLVVGVSVLAAAAAVLAVIEVVTR